LFVGNGVVVGIWWEFGGNFSVFGMFSGVFGMFSVCLGCSLFGVAWGLVWWEDSGGRKQQNRMCRLLGLLKDVKSVEEDLEEILSTEAASPQEVRILCAMLTMAQTIQTIAEMFPQEGGDESSSGR
jgi:hypothetical protein